MYYRQNGENLVVIYHGNAGRACDRNYYDEIFDRNNVSYIIVEYSGYAGDRSRPNRKRILQDVQNSIDKLATIKYSSITLLGESIGTGIALEHAQLNEPNKLILIAPFTKLSEVSRYHYPFLPSSLLGKEDYDNINNISEFEGELLIIHGEKDNIIPFKMGKRLFEKAVLAKEKEILPIKDRGHNDILSSPNLFQNISGFILK